MTYVSIKRGIEKKYNIKIKNLVDDMQWKIIKRLTENYKTILIGDMSSKEIYRQGNKILDGLTKQAVMQLNYYTFSKRLEYKYTVANKKYREINERYTSKMCSVCGWYNKKLGGNKEYKCEGCKLTMDRDVNGCRNIMVKGLL